MNCTVINGPPPPNQIQYDSSEESDSDSTVSMSELNVKIYKTHGDMIKKQKRAIAKWTRDLKAWDESGEKLPEEVDELWDRVVSMKCMLSSLETELVKLKRRFDRPRARAKGKIPNGLHPIRSQTKGLLDDDIQKSRNRLSMQLNELIDWDAMAATKTLSYIKTLVKDDGTPVFTDEDERSDVSFDASCIQLEDMAHLHTLVMNARHTYLQTQRRRYQKAMKREMTTPKLLLLAQQRKLDSEFKQEVIRRNLEELDRGHKYEQDLRRCGKSDYVCYSGSESESEDDRCAAFRD